MRMQGSLKGLFFLAATVLVCCGGEPVRDDGNGAGGLGGSGGSGSTSSGQGGAGGSGGAGGGPASCSAPLALPGTLTLSTQAAPSGSVAWAFEYTVPGQAVVTGLLVGPSGKGPFPAVVVSHGKGAAPQGFGLQKATAWFLPNGYFTIAPTYTHAGKLDCTADGDCAGSPENVRRARAALDILQSSELSAKIGEVIRRDRLYLYGNSMGAGVTVETAEKESCRVRAAAITAGGLVDELTPSGAIRVPDITAPLLHLHGRADTVVPPTVAQALLDALDAADRVHQMEWFPGIGHDLSSNAATTDVCRDFVLAFFGAHGDGPLPQLSQVSPGHAAAGEKVVIAGMHLGENPGGYGRVSFGGVEAKPETWADGSIGVKVPTGAATGKVRAVVPLGPVTSPLVEAPSLGGARANELSFTVD